MEAGFDALPLTATRLPGLLDRRLDLADGSRACRGACGTGLPATLLDDARQPRHAAKLKPNTEAAIAAGYSVCRPVWDGEVFWGRDRLDFVERALREATL